MYEPNETLAEEERLLRRSRRAAERHNRWTQTGRCSVSIVRAQRNIRLWIETERRLDVRALARVSPYRDFSFA
jgi:hypothetical protein